MESKPFYKSVTFWGTVLTTAATFIPKYAPVISAGTTAAFQIIGIVTTLVGRFRPGAGAPLTILPAGPQQ